MTFRFFRVESFRLLDDYRFSVSFDDGKTVNIDFEPVLFGELFGPFRDKRLFEQVKIDPEVNTLVWPNGADFDPNTLHDWDERKSFLIREAAKWEIVAPLFAKFIPP